MRFCWTFFSIFAFFALASTAAPAEAKPPTRSYECGSQATTSEIAEPPDVAVSFLPLNAQHAHELILSVHRDGGRFCYRYAFNGVSYNVPPTIRVHRGERFAIRIVNAMHGKTNAAHLSSNALTQCMPMAMPSPQKTVALGYLNHPMTDLAGHMPWYDTNIHFHGFQGPAAQENIFVSTLSTPLHACEYDLTIPRTQPPGTYFYHPHAHGASGDQVFGGLSGMWIVESDLPQIARENEHAIIVRAAMPGRADNVFAPNVSDSVGSASIRRLMSARPAPPVAYEPFHPPAWPSALALATAGRGVDPDPCVGIFAGPIMSVNRARTPATLNASVGTPQLLRILNATSDSVKLFRLRDSHGNAVLFHVVARDGIPFARLDAQPLAEYVAMNSLLLSPAGRADILVTPQQGDDLILYTAHVCLGPIQEAAGQHDLVYIHGIPSQRQSAPLAAATAIDLKQTRGAQILTYVRAHPSSVRRRAITYTEYGFPPKGKTPAHATFFITDTTNVHFSAMPFWPHYGAGDMVPARADVVVKAGTIEEWTLFNATAETHSFHIHQMAFVAEDDPSGAAAMLDTIVVPFGAQIPNKRDPDYPLIKPSATRILLDFRHVLRGTFVFHCHMLGHEDAGMMGVVKVE